jgi:hypothetical protein
MTHDAATFREGGESEKQIMTDYIMMISEGEKYKFLTGWDN